MTISRADRNELRAILELQYLAYQSEAEIYGGDIPPLKQTLDEVEREFDRGAILKATDENGAVIGSVRAFAENGSVYIGKLIVHPERRHNGIGTALLSAVEALYPDMRYELFTGSKSVKNIALYERQGYRIFAKKKVDDDLDFVYFEKQSSKNLFRISTYADRVADFSADDGNFS